MRRMREALQTWLAHVRARRHVPFATHSMNLITDAVVFMTTDGHILHLNPSAERLLRLDPRGTLNKPVDDCVVLHADDDADAPRLPIGSRLGAHWTLPADAVLVLPDGELIAVDGHCTPLDENGTSGALLILRDVSEQRRARRWLAFQATHDNLTALLNRAEIEKRIAYTIEQARSGGTAALLYIDLDQFRIINDTCGHHAGDEFLRRAGKALRAQLRNSEPLARLGGDEFAVLVPGRSADAVLPLAETLLQAIQALRFVWEQRVYRVTASVGIVEIGAHFQDWRQVLAVADCACFMAKEQGRARAWIARADDDRVRQRRAQMDWVGRITGALEDDRFMLCRQRIAPLAANGGHPHWEVLTRLRERDGSLAQPDQFIPAAERYGLMPMVDRWVVNAVLAHLGRHDGLRDRASANAINISGASISDSEFVRFIIASFRRYGVDPTRICFEITETTAATDFDAALRFINAMRKLGCRISLDDFGSGFSSFSYLKAFAVDYLKIDGAFVRDMDTDPTNARFVESINQLGKSLGLATIAEYAESASVVACLRRLGVDYAQGNYLGRPQQWLA